MDKKEMNRICDWLNDMYDFSFAGERTPANGYDVNFRMYGDYFITVHLNGVDHVPLASIDVREKLAVDVIAEATEVVAKWAHE